MIQRNAAVVRVLRGIVAVWCCGSAAVASAAEAPRPNILLIMTDDQGWWDLGVHGNKILQTPTLDRLAADGVRFSNYYVAPVCSVTRAGLMTGRYAFRTGLYNTRFGGDSLSRNEVTVAELLRQAGYRTGMFGKWHLGRYAGYQPQNRGFDDALFLPHGHAEHYDYADQLLFQGRPVETRGYITDVLTDAALEFMDEPTDQPFFCYVPYNVPHSPFIVSDSHDGQPDADKIITRYLERGVPLREARIYAMIERADDNIGRLLAALDDRGLAENTIVLFMSDNGGVHKHFTAGLRGAKASVYEGGVRSPLIVRWAKHAPAGKVVDAVVSHVDILPTLCELAGAAVPRDRPIDGRSIRALIENGVGESPHEYVYHSWNRFTPDPDRNWAIRQGQYKLVNGALFDLDLDPGEKRDLSDEQPQRARELRAEFERWFAEVTKGQTWARAPIEIGRADENPVEIQASWADLAGDWLIYTFRGYVWDTLDGWNRPEHRATWLVDVTEPGSYEVTASYGGNDGGNIRLRIDDAQLDARLPRTPSRDIFLRQTLGTIELPGGPTTLTVLGSESADAPAFSLNRLWFRRLEAGSQPSPKTAAGDE